MADTRTHEDRAEQHRQNAEALLSNLGPGQPSTSDKIALAQIEVLSALVSAFLAQTAKGAPAPTATPLR